MPDIGSDLPPDVACQAELVVTGSLLAESEVTTEDGACVPDGRWELEVALGDTGDCDEVPIEQGYAYEVVTAPDTGVIEVSYVGDAAADDDVYLKVTFEGGACTGNFEHQSAGGSEVVILRPYVEDGSISGRGVFERRGN